MAPSSVGLARWRSLRGTPDTSTFGGHHRKAECFCSVATSRTVVTGGTLALEQSSTSERRSGGWAECLQHARTLSRLLAPDADFQVLFRGRWYGLNGRQLSSVDSHQRFWMNEGRTSHQDEFPVQTMVDVGQIADNLPEIILPLLAPLYQQFGFFRLTMDHVRYALD